MSAVQDLLRERKLRSVYYEFIFLYPSNHIKFIKKLSCSKIVEFTFDIQKNIYK